MAPMYALPLLPQPAAGGYAALFSTSGLIHAPLSALLKYSSGVLRAQANGGGPQRGEAADGEVSIWIVGPTAGGAAHSWGWYGEAPAAWGDDAAEEVGGSTRPTKGMRCSGWKMGGARAALLTAPARPLHRSEPAKRRKRIWGQSNCIAEN